MEWLDNEWRHGWHKACSQIWGVYGCILRIWRFYRVTTLWGIQSYSRGQGVFKLHIQEANNSVWCTTAYSFRSRLKDKLSSPLIYLWGPSPNYFLHTPTNVSAILIFDKIPRAIIGRRSQNYFLINFPFSSITHFSLCPCLRFFKSTLLCLLQGVNLRIPLSCETWKGLRDENQNVFGLACPRDESSRHCQSCRIPASKEWYS